MRHEREGIRAIRIDTELLSKRTTLGQLHRNEAKIAARSRLLTEPQPREHKTHTPSNKIRPCGESTPTGLFGSTTIDCSACMENANTHGTADIARVSIHLQVDAKSPRHRGAPKLQALDPSGPPRGSAATPPMDKEYQLRSLKCRSEHTPESTTAIGCQPLGDADPIPRRRRGQRRRHSIKKKSPARRAARLPPRQWIKSTNSASLKCRSEHTPERAPRPSVASRSATLTPYLADAAASAAVIP